MASKLHQHLPFLDRLTGPHPDGPNRAGRRGPELVLHLHGLEDDEPGPADTVCPASTCTRTTRPGIGALRAARPRALSAAPGQAADVPGALVHDLELPPIPASGDRPAAAAGRLDRHRLRAAVEQRVAGPACPARSGSR